PSPTLFPYTTLFRSIFCVGRKGHEQLRRQYERNIIEHVELRSVRTIGFTNAEAIGEQIIDLYAKGAFDVCTLFFSRFRSVIAQIDRKSTRLNSSHVS